VTASTDVTSTDVTSEDGPTTDGPTTVHGAPRSVLVPFPSRRPGIPGAPADGAFTIDCAECAHRGTDVCDDCVVSFIVDREPTDALVVDAAEARAVRLLERAGLVPGVRHEARVAGR